MRKLLFSVLLLLCVECYAQVIADPATDQVNMAALSGGPIDLSALSTAVNFKLVVPVYNLNPNNPLPAGTCKIKIGLGSRIVLDPQFNIGANLSNYFSWFVSNSGGQVEITGTLIAQLPQNFNDTAEFIVRGSVLGASTITTNFLVTNHNTTVTLSDENPSNNNSSLAYNITSSPQPVPVKFVAINAFNRACALQVQFSVAEEVNVERYELEVSTDGMRYTKQAEMAAQGRSQYSFSQAFASGSADLLFVRVKSIDFDGKVLYSPVRSVSTKCDTRQLSVFPNPVTDAQYLTLSATAPFNGRYQLRLYAADGRMVHDERRSLQNAVHMQLRVSGLAAGSYVLQVLNQDNGERQQFQIKKM
jgi:hypothetical protein